MRGEGGEVGVGRSQTSHGSQRSGTSTIFMALVLRFGSFLNVFMLTVALIYMLCLVVGLRPQVV